MNKSKRIRIFAGPNGSGKSTLVDKLKNTHLSNDKMGVFVNADEIQLDLVNNGEVSLYQYFRFKIVSQELQEYILKFGMSPEKLNDSNIHKKFSVKKNRILFLGECNSYVAADIAAFVRVQLILKGKSFAFETVFSHESKLDIMKYAKSLGYKVYFYFLTTDDPDINVNRVKIRVFDKGHPVPEDKIIKRYYRSLNLMYDAVKLSSRAFLFDTSGKYSKLIAEIEKGKHVETLVSGKQIPNWFVKYFYNKTK